MVTLWALFSCVVPALLFVIYDPSLHANYPTLLYIVASVGVFLYQTLDALDGKQARRIKAFSPLGQLFDHGCDSFSTASMAVFMLVCLRVPNAKVNLAVYLSAITTVYLSNITEKFTHVMMISYGQIGVTEIQFMQIAALLLSGLGCLDWLYVPLIGGFSLNYLAAGIIIFVSVFSSSYFLLKTLEVEPDHLLVFKSLAPLGYVFIMSKRILPSFAVHV